MSIRTTTVCPESREEPDGQNCDFITTESHRGQGEFRVQFKMFAVTKPPHRIAVTLNEGCPTVPTFEMSLQQRDNYREKIVQKQCAASCLFVSLGTKLGLPLDLKICSFIRQYVIHCSEQSLSLVTTDSCCNTIAT